VSDEVAVKPFEGVVILKDWMPCPSTGRVARALAATSVTVSKQDELVGFHVKGGESNWVAVLEGNSETIYVLGCQVRAIARRRVSMDMEQSSETYFVR
jgi:hypothetical protein